VLVVVVIVVAGEYDVAVFVGSVLVMTVDAIMRHEQTEDRLEAAYVVHLRVVAAARRCTGGTVLVVVVVWTTVWTVVVVTTVPEVLTVVTKVVKTTVAASEGTVTDLTARSTAEQCRRGVTGLGRNVRRGRGGPSHGPQAQIRAAEGRCQLRRRNKASL